MGMLAPCVNGLFESLVEKVGSSVWEAGVMPGDEVAQQRTTGLDVQGEDCSGGGVVDYSGNIGGMRIGLGGEVGLPFRGKLPEIVPEACEAAPLFTDFPAGAWRKHLGSEMRSPEGNLVEMAVIRREVSTGLARLPQQSLAVKSEQWLACLAK